METRGYVVKLSITQRAEIEFLMLLESGMKSDIITAELICENGQWMVSSEEINVGGEAIELRIKEDMEGLSYETPQQVSRAKPQLI
jgi:hypothetical protein